IDSCHGGLNVGGSNEPLCGVARRADPRRHLRLAVAAGGRLIDAASRVTTAVSAAREIAIAVFVRLSASCVIDGIGFSGLRVGLVLSGIIVGRAVGWLLLTTAVAAAVG